MGSFVDLEVLTSGEHFSAAGKGTGEGFLSGVHADVVDQFVLGLEGPAVAGAAVPEAGVRGALGAADVLHGDVRDDFVHGAEHLGAHLARRQRLRLDPHAAQLLLQRRRLPHVAEEGAVRRHGRLRRRLVHRRRELVVVVRVGVARVLVLGAAVLVVVVVVGAEVGLGRRRRGAEHLVVRVVVRLRVVHRRVVLAPQQKVPGRVVVVVVADRGHRHRRRRAGAAEVLALVLLVHLGGVALGVAGAQLQPQPRRVHERVEHFGMGSRGEIALPEVTDASRAARRTQLTDAAARPPRERAPPPPPPRGPSTRRPLARTPQPIAQRGVPSGQWRTGGGRAHFNHAALQFTLFKGSNSTLC